MPSLGTSPENVGYWRRLAELAKTPELNAEILSGEHGPLDGPSRRRFMQIMGASLALAGVAGCTKDELQWMPLNVNLTDRTPGIPKFYATAMDLGGYAQGLLATSYDGRPIKVDGNPDHPQNQGASTVFTIGSLLGLYDPDRGTTPARYRNRRAELYSWDDFEVYARPIFENYRKTKGAGLHVLSEASSSDTLAAVKARFAETYPQASWHEYEPISRDNERAGTKLAFGKVLRPQYSLKDAQVIVCVDDCLLTEHPAAVKFAREFAARRRPEDGPMNRLYAVESVFSNTGAMADHRLALRADRIGKFVAHLEGELKRSPADREAKPAIDAAQEPTAAKLLAAMVQDLEANKGKGLVVVGPRQPAAVHAAAYRINALLGNTGKTITFTTEPNADRPTHLAAIEALAGDLEADKVETLLILGGNPVYNAPANLQFARALGKARQSIHLSLIPDETSQLCSWYLPRAHYLESWGDARSFDGTYSVVQPLIEPLRGGRSDLELLSLALGEETPAVLEAVRSTFKKISGETDFEDNWRTALDRGLLEGSAWKAEDVGTPADAPLPEPSPSNDSLELVFRPDTKIYDGRFSNNGWLQELPDFLTKMSWDNGALIAPATAKKLSIKNGQIVKLTLNKNTLRLPAYVLPGQPEGSVTLTLGYGRVEAGVVGGSGQGEVTPVGGDAYRLRAAAAVDFASGLKVEPTDALYEFAMSQDPFQMDKTGEEERLHRLHELAREGTEVQFAENPKFAKMHDEEREDTQLFTSPLSDEGHKWGMAVDLSRCVGCNACVIGCQAENNIPIVGRDQVRNGREMYWMRIDRYFKGVPEAPEIVHQPVACQHCETAPCEQVCPFTATVHSKEGLNDMVYNRCVGTRYCSNNCPYKVRRFNFFNYHKDLNDPINDITKLAYNPEVTVRSRGVMEKCSYCVHRIQNVKIQAKNAGREIGPEEITPACAQACPAQAITFGDLLREESKVAKDHANPRSYALLGELETRPRTAYLARIRNPHPSLTTEESAHEHA
jgi:molybdopterin-containing oxidoreductase family iron-sulfur binding subunit